MFHSRYVPSRSRGPPARPPSPKNRRVGRHLRPLHPPRAPPSAARPHPSAPLRPVPPARRQLPPQHRPARRPHLHRTVPGHRHQHPLRDHPPAALRIRLQHRPRIHLGTRPRQRVRRLRPRPVPAAEHRAARRHPHPQRRPREMDHPAARLRLGAARRPRHPRPLRPPPRQRRRIRPPAPPRRTHRPQPLRRPDRPDHPYRPHQITPVHAGQPAIAGRVGAPFNCRSPARVTLGHPWPADRRPMAETARSGPRPPPRAAPHPRPPEYGLPTLVHKSITWHRPGKPCHAHSPGPRAVRARRTRRVPPGSRIMTTAPQSAHQPEPLWQPGPDRIAGAQVTRFHTWAAAHHGAPAPHPRRPRRELRRPAPLVRRRTLHLLAGHRRVVRRPLHHPVRDRPRRPRHARRPLVPRRHPQLRRARAAHRRRPGPRRRPRPAPRRRDPRAHPRHLGRTARPGRLARRRAAPPRRPPRRPGQRLPPQHPPGRRRPPRHRRRRRACGPPAPPTSAPAASWTASSRSNPSSCSPSTATATAARNTTARDTVAELRAELPTLRAVVHIPLLGTPAPEGALHWADLTSRRHRTGLRTGPLRPPAVGPLLLRHDRTAQGHRPVPGRHPRSNTSSRPACTATSAPTTASSGTPPPAG